MVFVEQTGYRFESSRIISHWIIQATDTGMDCKYIQEIQIQIYLHRYKLGKIIFQICLV